MESAEDPRTLHILDTLFQGQRGVVLIDNDGVAHTPVDQTMAEIILSGTTHERYLRSDFGDRQPVPPSRHRGPVKTADEIHGRRSRTPARDEADPDSRPGELDPPNWSPKMGPALEQLPLDPRFFLCTTWRNHELATPESVQVGLGFSETPGMALTDPEVQAAWEQVNKRLPPHIVVGGKFIDLSDNQGQLAEKLVALIVVGRREAKSGTLGYLLSIDDGWDGYLPAHLAAEALESEIGVPVMLFHPHFATGLRPAHIPQIATDVEARLERYALDRLANQLSSSGPDSLTTMETDQRWLGLD